MRSQFLLAAGLASLAAADTTCTVTSTTTLSGANPTAFSGCDVVDGDVLLGDGVSGTASLSNVKTITGDLSSENNMVNSIVAQSLTEISGTLNLVNLTSLSSVNMPELTKVGQLHFEALAALSGLSFDKNVDTASSVLITNTFLGSLDGINLDTVTDFNINNNGRLTKIDTQIGSIKGNLIIEANGAGLQVSFPNLKYASNFTIRNAKTIDIPSLQAINGSMGFYENQELQAISAPNLTTVGINGGSDDDGGIAIVNNVKLTDMSFPEFARSGGQVQVANNTLLSNISFPKLVFVSGAIDFSGNFTTPNLPAITDVKGAFNVQSQQDIDCTAFSNERGGALQGKYTCKTTNNTKDLSNGGGEGSSSSGKGSKKSSAAQAGLSLVTCGTTVVGGLLLMLML